MSKTAQINGGVPAFLNIPNEYDYGLTKRELFAAMAMQGLATYKSAVDFELMAPLAVKWADALLNALEGNGDE